MSPRVMFPVSLALALAAFAAGAPSSTAKERAASQSSVAQVRTPATLTLPAPRAPSAPPADETKTPAEAAPADVRTPPDVNVPADVDTAPTAPTPIATPPAEESPTAAPTPADCGVPPVDRAPDPRCGETLDGREVAPAQNGAARGALAVPRVATHAILWPFVETTDVMENHHLLDWMEAIFTTDDGLVGVRPVINYSTGFRPSAGLRAFYRRLPGNTELAAHYETAGPGLNIARLHFRSLAKMGIFIDGEWVNRNDLLFAGIGPNSTSDLMDMGRGLARYSVNALDAQALWTRKLPAYFVVRLHGDILRRTYGDSSVRGGPPVSDFYGLPPDACASIGEQPGCVNPMQMPEFNSGERLVHGGGGFAWDFRRPGREGPGASMLIDANYAHGIAGDPSEHITYSADGVVAVGGINRTFLVRGHAAMVDKLGNAPIPFEELVMPSGSAGMRGFLEGRFRDASGIVATAEYRWYISSYLDASLFTDWGTVAGRNFQGLGSSQWFPTYGLGLRWFKTQGPYWEAAPRGGFQLAYGQGYGLRFLLTMASF
jgi:hypothetical protein